MSFLVAGYRESERPARFEIPSPMFRTAKIKPKTFLSLLQVAVPCSRQRYQSLFLFIRRVWFRPLLTISEIVDGRGESPRSHAHERVHFMVIEHDRKVSASTDEMGFTGYNMVRAVRDSSKTWCGHHNPREGFALTVVTLFAGLLPRDAQ